MRDNAFVLLEQEFVLGRFLSVDFLVFLAFLVVGPVGGVHLQAVTDVLHRGNGFGQGLEQGHDYEVDEARLGTGNIGGVSVTQE